MESETSGFAANTASVFAVSDQQDSISFLDRVTEWGWRSAGSLGAEGPKVDDDALGSAPRRIVVDRRDEQSRARTDCGIWLEMILAAGTLAGGSAVCPLRLGVIAHRGFAAALLGLLLCTSLMRVFGGRPVIRRSPVRRVKYFHTHCSITRSRRSLPISA